MSRETGGHGVSARRRYLNYGGDVLGGGPFAGCTGGTGSESTATRMAAAEANPIRAHVDARRRPSEVSH